MSSKRPKLLAAKQAFKEVYEDVGKTVSGAGTKIGGKVSITISILYRKERDVLKMPALYGYPMC